MLAVAGCLGVLSYSWVAAQRGVQAPAIDADDIGGIVRSSRGPEAGVWVIAENRDVAARLVRTVVTDDQGRYVLPDLPRGMYQVWTRGFGLIDSRRVAASLGRRLDLTAVVAPNPRAAADYYPPKYWMTLLDGSKLDLGIVKDGCMNCHQLGNQATRTMPPSLGTFETSLEAWDRRTRSGSSGPPMSADFQRLGPARKAFADWTDRIAAGAFPTHTPPRPKGIERNLVVSTWDWGEPTSFMHTIAATDRGDPTINHNGRIYGPDMNTDNLLWLDPVEHKAGGIKIPTRDAGLKPAANLAPSPYWGDQTWPGVTMTRSGAMDRHGRVWIASRFRGARQPNFCKSGSANPFAQYFPIDQASTRQVAMWDPRTEQWTLIDTCYTADHNEFGPGPDHSLYFGTNNVVGWVNTRILDETKKEEAAQGWCPAVLDTNGDGTITRGWTEPDQAVDPGKDHRITFGCYYDAVNPVDGSVWCSGSAPAKDRRHLVRMELGAHPPQTCKAERYVAPQPADLPMGGERGIAIDTNGVVWLAWRQSDHLTSFDRRKCKGPLNGPQATGSQCAEGWSIYRRQGEPTIGNSNLFGDDTYSLDVDQFDWLGLGVNTKILGTVNSNALQVLLPSGEFIDLHIPYPMGFFTRNVHGRIDDPKQGWKGRGAWTGGMTYTAWHQEGGKGEKLKIVKLQIRPGPLAK